MIFSYLYRRALKLVHRRTITRENPLDVDLEMDGNFDMGGGDYAKGRYSPDSPDSPIYKESPKESSFSFVNAAHNRSGNVLESPIPAKQSHDSPYLIREEIRKDDSRSSSTSSSFKRNSSLRRLKTSKSRLQYDPGYPHKQDKDQCGKVAKSGRMRSGVDEEEDPFAGDDIPKQYKKQAKFGIVVVFQWVALGLIIGSLIWSITTHNIRQKKLWGLALWKWEVLVLVLLCGQLISGMGVQFIIWFIKRKLTRRKQVLYFIYKVRRTVHNCLWLGLVLIAWHFLFDEKVAREFKGTKLPYLITKFLLCSLVGTLLWLVKTLLVKISASSFHVRTYFDRIQDSVFNQYVIKTLAGPTLIEIQNNKEEEEKAKAEKIAINRLHKLDHKNISAWRMKKLMSTVRHGVLSTLDEQIQNLTVVEEEPTAIIKSECDAKCAAKKIFYNVANPLSTFIYLEDLMCFMSEEEAWKTWSLFEGVSENNRISRRALKNWMVNAFRERRALALTLDDTKSAVKQLHHILNVIVGVVILVISLLILGIATTQFLVFLSSQFLLVAFMFGNTCKMIFEAIIFLFVMHPFDVGDRVEVDDVQMVVEEMNILTTVFLRYDNRKIIYPNSVLSVKPIHNFFRSPDMGEEISFCVHVSTPTEKIGLMRQRITAFIENKKEHWHPAPMVVLRDMEEMNKLNISIWFAHRMNHQDMGERWTRRAFVLEELIKILKELDIEYRMLPLDINVQNAPAGLSSTRFPSLWNTCSNTSGK